MESNCTVSSNPDTVGGVDIEHIDVSGPSSSVMSTCGSATCGSDYIAHGQVGPTQEQLTTSLSENSKTESSSCNASVTLPEKSEQVSVFSPVNNYQSSVDLSASFKVNNDHRNLNCATNTVNGVDQQCTSRKNDTFVQQENASDIIHSTVIYNAEGCKAVETLVNNIVMTDAEAVSDAVKLHANLVTDIDKSLTKMNCGQLADLPQYLQLKQLCQHLQNMVEQQLAKQERLQAQNERLALQLVAAPATPLDHSLLDAESSCKKTESQTATRILLESTVDQLKKELASAKSAASTQEANLKRQVAAFKAEHNAKFETLNRQYEECKRDKDMMVLRYAQAEQRNLELCDSVQKADARVKEWSREREVAVNRWNAMRADNSRMAKTLEANASELSTLKRDLERQKELASSADVQAKFHQNRLKEEIDRHKETRSKLDESFLVHRELCGDLERVGLQLHELNLFLEAQQVAGFPLTSPLIKDALHDVSQKQEKNAKNEVCVTILKEIAGVLLKQKELTDELIACQGKVHQLEAERQHLSVSVSELDSRLQNEQVGTGSLLEKVAELDQLKNQLQLQSLKLTELSKNNAELEQTRDDVIAEMESHRKREAESLEFTERITMKNSHLQSENLHLLAEIESLKRENANVSQDLAAITDRNDLLNKDLCETRVQNEQQRISLTRELTEQIQLVRELKQRVQDLEDEIKTINRRHASNVKDLTRQLNRRLESQDIKGNVGSDQDSASINSVELSDSQDAMVMTSSQSGMQEDIPLVVEVVKVDRKMFLDKIVSLQKKLARKNEKIDFLEDHINHLTEDINKKSRIIQGYILSQDTGVMSSEKSDKLKAQLARKGGVMASLYRAQCQDGKTMTVELALEIANKLQALLEDTLLKNMTLKDNMDTLGRQVDSLLQENRRLRDHSVGTRSLLQLDS